MHCGVVHTCVYMLCSKPVGIFVGRGNPVSYWRFARVLSLGALMKLESISVRWQKKKSGIIYEPLYTLPEIADRLGMEHKTIVGYMKSKGEGKPKPVMHSNSSLRMKQNLYKLSEFKVWIKTLEKYK